mmetsp:Transcript_18476/g.47244  ORF Transcript_18476/g.47244 Transcript_18476/m.47244 type:complete len:240 (-) Transcript_18476:499-1218(-)
MCGSRADEVSSRSRPLTRGCRCHRALSRRMAEWLEAEIPVVDPAVDLSEVPTELLPLALLRLVQVRLALIDVKFLRREQVGAVDVAVHLLKCHEPTVGEAADCHVRGEVILEAIVPLDARLVDAGCPTNGVRGADAALVTGDGRAELRGGAGKPVLPEGALARAHAQFGAVLVDCVRRKWVHLLAGALDAQRTRCLGRVLHLAALRSAREHTGRQRGCGQKADPETGSVRRVSGAWLDG